MTFSLHDSPAASQQEQLRAQRRQGQLSPSDYERQRQEIEQRNQDREKSRQPEKIPPPK